MDHATNTSTEYDDWVANPDNLAQHLAGILQNLTQATAEPERKASINRRWPYLVDPATGHLNGHDLCWICSSALVHSGPTLPKLRACRWCLAQDRHQAARLGLRHLLPVFDWPAPPVRDRVRADQHDQATRDATTDAWSQVSTLDRWRRDCVALAYEWMEVAAGDVVDLYDWQSRLGVGAHRSFVYWAAYVDGYHPNLRRALIGGSASKADLR